MKKLFLLGILTLFFMGSMMAQEIVIKKNNTPKPRISAAVTEGMRYRDFDDLYNYRKYKPQPDDPYNPTLAGVASFLIPGLGQGLCDEWGRGLAFFAGHALFALCFCNSEAIGTAFDNFEAGEASGRNISTLATGIALWLAYDIWNTVDAIHVAKIKNLYYQDLKGRQAYIQMNVSPCLTYVRTPDTNAPVMGLSLNIGF